MSDARIGDLLDKATETLRLPLEASQRQQLLGYVALLDKWNRTYNLTAVRTPLDMMRIHVIDCLAVVAPLQAQLRSLNELPHRLLDVGSGAGLPGLILAIALPELQVTCLDSVGKKVAFMAQAASTLRIDNAGARHARVETFTEGLFDVISSRALSTLQNFVEQSKHLLLPWGRWMAMKGLRPGAEIDDLEGGVKFHVEHVTVPGVTAERCVVWIHRPEDSVRTLTPDQTI